MGTRAPSRGLIGPGHLVVRLRLMGWAAGASGGRRPRWHGQVVRVVTTPRGRGGYGSSLAVQAGKCRHEIRRPTHPHGVEARLAPETFRSPEPADEVPGSAWPDLRPPARLLSSRVVRCDAGPMRASGRKDKRGRKDKDKDWEIFLRGITPPSWPARSRGCASASKAMDGDQRSPYGRPSTRTQASSRSRGYPPQGRA